ncbi:MAG: type II toxin-antitoxin system PemK/MazF family toxin [Armatimonadetes bacterium]|nr:type II toxin-antitoxin system PemK/MazF family toxin [Armatimonadota bacterium]
MAQRRRMARGDVYRVSYVFPHERDTAPDAAEVEKERPVLILQNDLDNDNERYPLVLAAPITTQKTDRVYEQDVLLPAGEANLTHTSKVLLGLTQPFLKSRLGQRVGRISQVKMKQVELRLLRLFGILRRAEGSSSGSAER